MHIGGTDFDKYLSLAAVMPLLGLGSRLRSGSEVPSSYYFNLATWHTINLAYTQKSDAAAGRPGPRRLRHRASWTACAA